jgi:hypothetical protein
MPTASLCLRPLRQSDPVLASNGIFKPKTAPLKTTTITATYLMQMGYDHKILANPTANTLRKMAG